MPPRYFRALRQLLVQSELIELLNICFIDNTDLVLWLTYCMKKYFLYLGANMSKKCVCMCVCVCVWGGGGGGEAVAPRLREELSKCQLGTATCTRAPPPPFSYTTELVSSFILS